MSDSLLIKKIKAAGTRKLIIIIYYRILKSIMILKEQLWISFFKRPRALNKRTPDGDEIKQLFKSYYSLCEKGGYDAISDSIDVQKGYINLFGSRYTFNECNWLQDPLSGKSWDRNVFFTKAKVEETGLGDVKYVMEVNKLYHIVSLAQAFYKTKEKSYIQTINKLLTSQRKCIQYERSVVNKSMLDLVYRCYNYIHIVLLCYENDDFRKKTLPDIFVDIQLIERQIRKFSTPRWCKFSSGANHTIGEMAGLLTIQLFLQYFANLDYSKFFKTEYKFLYASLNPIISQKGVYLEQSANYSKLVTEFLIILDIFVKAVGQNKERKYYDDSYLKKLLNYISTISFNNTLPDFGDNDGAKALKPFYTNDDSVEHIIRYKNLNYGESTDYCLICNESGQFSWKSNLFHLFMRAGRHSYLPIGSGSHAHNDINAILVSTKDGPLFIDHGTFLYNSGMDILNRDRSTMNHNTIYIKGFEQASFAGKWKYGSYPISIIDEENTTYDKESFKFSGICKYNGRTHNRKVLYKECRLIIEDSIECNNTDEIYLKFLLASNIIASNNNGIILLNNDNKLLAKIKVDCESIITFSDTEYHPSYGRSENTTKISIHSLKNGSQTIKTCILFE